MHEINIKLLKDKALDVDPDLRFMALDDFLKYLTSLSNLRLESPSVAITVSAFMPSLFRLLSDHNTDVQSQAVKTFAPAINYLPLDEAVNVIDHLYHSVLEANLQDQKARFTSSIPNMTLRGVLNSTYITQNPKLCRAIVDRILPQWHAHDITFDSIELLLDLVKNLGHVLSQKENRDLNSLIIRHAFDSRQEVVVKRGLHVLKALSQNTKDKTIVEDALNFVLDKASGTDPLKYKYITIELGSHVLSEPVMKRIYTDVISVLSQENDADEEIDQIIQSNIAKENCLGVLQSFIESKNNIEGCEQELLAVISKFSTYTYDEEDMDFDDDGSDDIVFSDDEMDDNDDDDGSWKLRLKAAQMLRSYVSKFPHQIATVVDMTPKLPINDKNSLVVNEFLKTLCFIVDATTKKNQSVDPQQPFSELSRSVLDVLFVPSKTQHLSQSLSLVESLNKSGYISQDFISSVFKRLETLGADENYLGLYKNVLEHIHGDLAASITTRIVADLEIALGENSLNTIAESLKVLNLLLESVSFPTNKIASLLAQKLQNSKSYPSELIQRIIYLLGELVGHECDSSFDISGELFQCLKNESTSKPALEVLIKLANRQKLHIKAMPEGLDVFVSKWISGSEIADEHKQQLSLQFLLALASHYGLELPNHVTDELVKLTLSKSPIVLDLTCRILVLENVFSRLDEAQLLENLFVLLSNEELDVSDEGFFGLLRRSVQSKPDLFSTWQNKFNSSSALHAKALAVLAVENHLENEISLREQQLATVTSENLLEVPEIYFAIQFLGFCAEDITLHHVDIAHVLELINQLAQSKDVSVDDKELTNNSAEVLKSALAATIGAVVQGSGKVNELLEYHKNPAYKQSRSYVVMALKTVVKKHDVDEVFWNTLWENILSMPFEHSSCGELRITGALLSQIALKTPEKFVGELISLGQSLQAAPQDKLSATYTMSVVIKHIVNDLEDEVVINAVLSQCLQWMSILSNDLRQLIVGILLTCLHNKPGVILPRLNTEVLPAVYEQLKSEDAFKKVIKMGPYTYVMDEGLEIRKLVYELLYAIGSLGENVLDEYGIEVSAIAVQIIEHGLKDDQIDIVILSCVTLLHFVNNHPGEMAQLFSHNVQIVESLKVHLGKKLSEKASAQVSESHLNRERAIINLGHKALEILAGMEDMDRETKAVWVEFAEQIKK